MKKVMKHIVIDKKMIQWYKKKNIYSI
jgi:hypothetical protein